MVQTIPAYKAIRLAHLSVDISKIHNGCFGHKNPLHVVEEYRAILEDYNLPVCSDAFLEKVEAQAEALNLTRRENMRKLIHSRTCS